jgi:trans-aconitate methyltransferase
MIAFARRSFGPPALANLRFEEANAASLTFGPEFDCVVSFACLHWVIDHRPVLAGIRRALRPGGRTLLQFGGRGNASEVVAAATTVIERDRWRNCFKDFPFPWGFHDPQEYRAWLQEAQLEPTRVELVPKDMTHRGREGLIGWVRTTWMPYFHRVPAQDQETFIAEVADEYLRLHPPDGQQVVHLKMVRLEAEARRGV